MTFWNKCLIKSIILVHIAHGNIFFAHGLFYMGTPFKHRHERHVAIFKAHTDGSERAIARRKSSFYHKNCSIYTQTKKSKMPERCKFFTVVLYLQQMKFEIYVQLIIIEFREKIVTFY